MNQAIIIAAMLLAGAVGWFLGGLAVIFDGNNQAKALHLEAVKAKAAHRETLDDGSIKFVWGGAK